MKIYVGDVLKNDPGVVVHGCNSRGVMGSGIAKQIRDQFPDVYDDYRQAFEKNGLALGDVIWSPPRAGRVFWIANAITQENFGRDPKVRYVSYDAIAQCFKSVAEKSKSLSLDVRFPKIGAGLGNGNWQEISSIIADQLKDISYDLWLHPSDPEAKKTFRIK